MNNLIFNTITSELGEYCYRVTQEITNPQKLSIKKLIDALHSEPIASACLSVKCARSVQHLNNRYVHKENPKIQEFIRNNFSNMESNLPQFVYRMGSAMGLGFSSAEILFRVSLKHITLRGFNILDPEKTTFNVHNGMVREIKYIDSGMTKYIPKWKYLHITNGSPCLFGINNVFGNPELAKAYSLIRLKQLILANMAVAAKRLATGIILGVTDTTAQTQVIDSLTGQPKIDSQTGKPMMANNGKVLLDQLKSIENFGVIVTDKNNAVSTLNVNGGEQFWSLALQVIDQQIMRCFQIPDTVFQQPTNPFGNGMTSTNQLSILDSSIMGFVSTLRDELMEKVVKPLIILNYGKQSNGNYGYWDTQNEDERNKEQQQLTNLMQAMSMGLISNQNYEAQNLLMSLIGLPTVTPETTVAQKTMEAQIQGMQQSVAQQVAQPEPEQPQETEKKDVKYP